MLFNSILETIGNTPILRLNSIEKEFNLNVKLYAKLEYFNPAGSIKDRVALNMVVDFENQGKLKKGGTIIEPTSGNTGIGLAMVCKAKGYKLILTMPNNMSVERQQLVKAYGATVILTDGSLGMQGAIDKAIELNKEIPNSVIAGQFDNQSNPNAHYNSTAPEIYKDLNGDIDYFFATVGTGGTFTGISKYLKEQNPNIKCIAVEPSSSPLISNGISGSHKIQGIGANFIPKVLDKTLIDKIITCPNDEAFNYAKLLGEKEGFLCGISSGACLYASIKFIQQENLQNKSVVIVLPDSADRYLSTELFK